MNLLEILFNHDFESRGKDDPQVEAAYKDFCRTMLEIDPVRANEIKDAVAVLCMAHQRSGFMAGARAYNHLMRELSE